MIGLLQADEIAVPVYEMAKGARTVQSWIVSAFDPFFPFFYVDFPLASDQCECTFDV